jgi:hypothetical protein
MSLCTSIRPKKGNRSAHSGHQRAPSNVFGFGPLTFSGMSIVAPFPTETFPHQAHPSVGRRIGPAPLVLLKG